MARKSQSQADPFFAGLLATDSFNRLTGSSYRPARYRTAPNVLRRGSRFLSLATISARRQTGLKSATLSGSRAQVQAMELATEKLPVWPHFSRTFPQACRYP